MLKYRRIGTTIRERQLSQTDERRKKWQKQTQTNVPTNEFSGKQQHQQKR